MEKKENTPIEAGTSDQGVVCDNQYNSKFENCKLENPLHLLGVVINKISEINKETHGYDFQISIHDGMVTIFRFKYVLNDSGELVSDPFAAKIRGATFSGEFRKENWKEEVIKLFRETCKDAEALKRGEKL